MASLCRGRPAGRVLVPFQQGWERAVIPFGAVAAAGESGPVIVLSGEADLTVVPVLEEVLGTQVASGVPLVTVDLSGLTFADSAAIAVLVRASRALHERGGVLELVHPRPAVARTLALLGVDQALTVRDGSVVADRPPGTETLPPP
jgi:anti-sigma B factor antagonist